MKIFALAALLLIVGCANQKMVWSKQGSTEQQFYEESGQCKAQAFGMAGASLQRSVIVYEACMQGKGWYQRPA